MKTLNSFITEIKQGCIVVTANSLGLYKYLDDNALNIWGFGQDNYSSGTSSEYSVYRLAKKDWVEHDGDLYKAVSVQFSNDEIVLQTSYVEAKSNATEYDEMGKGYSIK